MSEVRTSEREDKNQLSETFLKSLWNSEYPLEFLSGLVKNEFKELGDLVTEEDSKLKNVISEYIIRNFIFCFKELKLSYSGCSKYLETCIKLLSNSIQNNFASAEKDLEFFKETLSEPDSDNLVFTQTEVKELEVYIKRTFFSHYLLYKYLLNNQRQTELYERKILVDLPLPKEKHQNYVQKPQEPEETKPVYYESATEEEEPPPEQPPRFDEAAKAFIQTKLNQAKESMIQSLAQREELLNKKLEEKKSATKKKK